MKDVEVAAELEHRLYNQENVALLVYLLCDRRWASYHLLSCNSMQEIRILV